MHFDDVRIGVVFCHELADLVDLVVVEAFEGWFVVDEDGDDLAVFDEGLLFNKNVERKQRLGRSQEKSRSLIKEIRPRQSKKFSVGGTCHHLLKF